MRNSEPSLCSIFSRPVLESPQRVSVLGFICLQPSLTLYYSIISWCPLQDLMKGSLNLIYFTYKESNLQQIWVYLQHVLVHEHQVSHSLEDASIIHSRLEYLNAIALHYILPHNSDLSTVTGTVCVGDHYSLRWYLNCGRQENFSRSWLNQNTLALFCPRLGWYLDVHQLPLVSHGSSVGFWEWSELCHCPQHG